MSPAHGLQSRDVWERKVSIMLKKIVICILMVSNLSLIGCPTCWGRITHDSPSIMNAHLYQPYKTPAAADDVSKNNQQNQTAQRNAPQPSESSS